MGNRANSFIDMAIASLRKHDPEALTKPQAIDIAFNGRRKMFGIQHNGRPTKRCADCGINRGEPHVNGCTMPGRAVRP